MTGNGNTSARRAGFVDDPVLCSLYSAKSNDN